MGRWVVGWYGVPGAGCTGYPMGGAKWAQGLGDCRGVRWGWACGLGGGGLGERALWAKTKTGSALFFFEVKPLYSPRLDFNDCTCTRTLL